MREIIRLSVLTFMAGAVCKLYDDLVDNAVNIPYADYVNEFLKGVHYILLTYVSADYIYPMLMFVVVNLTAFLFDRSAFGTYETAGVFAFTLFCCYLLFYKFAQVNTVIFFILAAHILGTYFTDVCLFKDVEYGYKKLCIRGTGAAITASVLIANSYFQYLPDEYLFFMWYVVGYYIVSTLFQIYFIFVQPPRVNVSSD
jgi:hypothetical protein